MTRDELKIEREKLSQMDFKNKVIYIFSYYTVEIIVLCVFIYILIQVGLSLYDASRDDMLYCMVINEVNCNGDEADAVDESFREYAGLEGRKQRTTFDISVDMDDTDASYYEASYIKFSSLQGTGTIDVIISTKDFLIDYSAQDMFLNLWDVLPKELFDELSDRIYFAENIEGKYIPVAISLDDSYLSEMITLEPGSYITITNMEHFPDTVIDFIRYCYGL